MSSQEMRSSDTPLDEYQEVPQDIKATQENFDTKQIAENEKKTADVLTEEEAKHFDYVVPKESYKEHRKQSKKHAIERAKKHAIERAKKPAKNRDGFYDDFVFVTHSRKKRHKKRWPLPVRILIVFLCVIVGLAAALAGTYLILNEIGRRSMLNYDDFSIEMPTQEDESENIAKVSDEGYTIVYDGKTYALNRDMMSIVFIGYKEEGNGDAMADAVYIIGVDTNTGKVSLIGVSRDTMTDIGVYSTEGKFIETDRRQLCYAYSYSGKDVTSGENVCTSLERMFFGMPFDNYFALDLDAVEQLNDSIGGVTLTSTITFQGNGRTIYEGEEVTLHGSEAITYIQTREFDQLDSNSERMERQRQYIQAFIASVLPAAKKDLSNVTNLFTAVSEHSDTTLDLPKVTYIGSIAASKMRSADDMEYISLTGEYKEGEFAELYVDDTTILEAMLQVFYTPID